MKVFVFLMLELAVLTGCRADELNWSNHHFSGMAVVTHGMDHFLAAFQVESFDPSHTPELGFRTLMRIYLVPYQIRRVQRSVLETTSTIQGTSEGHAILRFGDWSVDMLPVEYDQRKTNISGATAGQVGRGDPAKFVIDMREDEILIVMAH